jgi:hypothetical protein
MNVLQLSFVTISFALALTGSCTATAEPLHEKAAQHCEDEVAATIGRVRSPGIHNVQFKRAARATSAEGYEIRVQGQGHYQQGIIGNAISFTYSCAFNTETGTTSGVVFRENKTLSSAAQKVWQPDLSKVSPEACETAIAALLKGQYPRVNGIIFLSETRKLQPSSGTQISLEGKGTLQRALGMKPNSFKYQCEFEQNAGKLVKARMIDREGEE